MEGCYDNASLECRVPQARRKHWHVHMVFSLTLADFKHAFNLFACHHPTRSNFAEPPFRSPRVCAQVKGL